MPVSCPLKRPTGTKDRQGFDQLRDLTENEFDDILRNKPSFQALPKNYVLSHNKDGIQDPVTRLNISAPKIIWQSVLGN